MFKTSKYKFILLGLCLIYSLFVYGQDVVVDKIVLNIDNTFYTKSQIDRIKSNFEKYKAFSPRIHNFLPTDENIVKSIIHQNLIKKHLTTINYVISDEHINDEIKSNERARGINRQYLIDYLEKNDITFNEYFNIIGRTIEYDLFYTRTITPLISISDQQIKNLFYEKYKDISSLSFNYDLMSFTFEATLLKKEELNTISDLIKIYLKNKITTPQLKSMDVNNLGSITEEGLSPQIIAQLHATEEGDISKPLLIGNQYHFFYVKKKDLVESSRYLSEKKRIKDLLIEKEAEKVMAVWFKKEIEKHHIKTFN